MRFFCKVLFLVLPLMAMQLVLKNEQNGMYMQANGKNHSVLMYLDLAMNVFIAFVIGTVICTTLSYNKKKVKQAFAPTLYIMVIAGAITTINLFVYETKAEQHNKDLLASELQALQELTGTTKQQAHLLEGYWILKKEDDTIGPIFHYDGEQEDVLIQNTAFCKIDEPNTYELQFDEGLGVLNIERSGMGQQEYIRFIDEQTIIGVTNGHVGVSKDHFRTMQRKTFMYELDRVSIEQLEQYRQKEKHQQGAI